MVAHWYLAGFTTWRSGLKSFSIHLNHYVSREFTYNCSWSTQPSYTSTSRQKWWADVHCGNNWHFPRITSPESWNSQRKLVSACRNGRAAPTRWALNLTVVLQFISGWMLSSWITRLTMLLTMVHYWMKSHSWLIMLCCSIKVCHTASILAIWLYLVHVATDRD